MHDEPVCADCGHDADMFTEGEWICDACDDRRSPDLMAALVESLKPENVAARVAAAAKEKGQ